LQAVRERGTVQEHLGQDSRVVVGVVLLQLLHPPVLREGGQPKVGDVEFEAPRQCHRAQPLVYGQ
jgi:hypothetical protein